MPSLTWRLPIAIPLALVALMINPARSTAAEQTFEVTIDAGDHDRHQCPVTFAMPSGIGGGAWRLRGDDGARLAVQVDDRGQAHALVADLKKAERRRFLLEAEPAPAPAAIEVKTEGDALRLSAGGHELLSYQGGAGELPPGYDPAFRRGGYLSRVYTPTGTLVTDDYPPNHRHHHGVWFSWTKTEFDGRKPDFWNMGDKTGTVVAIARDGQWNGAAWAGFHARHRYLDLGAATQAAVLDETWDVTVQAPSGDRPALLIDLVVTDTCAGDKPLVLPTYHYGGIGIRGNRQWDGKDNLRFLTSEGRTRADGNESRGRWSHLGGAVDGHAAGIAVFDHPQNFRSPQPMRIHPNEPFFCYAPSQLGNWAIEPGKPLVLRYRLVVSDGLADAADLDRRWLDYAEPPQVTVVPRKTADP